MAEPDVVEPAVKRRDEAVLDEILHRLDADQPVALHDDAVRLEPRHHAEHLAGAFVHGDDVGFLVVVVVEVVPAVLFEDGPGRVEVARVRLLVPQGRHRGRRGRPEVHIRPDAGVLPLAHLVVPQVKDVRCPRRRVERLRVARDHHVLRHDEFGAIPPVAMVPVDLLEGAPVDRRDVAEAVLRLLPALHLVQHLPRHMPTDAFRALALLARGVETGRPDRNRAVAVDEARISTRGELDGADREQRVLDVRGAGPRIRLFLRHLSGEVVALLPHQFEVAAFLAVAPVAVDHIGGDAGDLLRRQHVDEVDGRHDGIQRQGIAVLPASHRLVVGHGNVGHGYLRAGTAAFGGPRCGPSRDCALPATRRSPPACPAPAGVDCREPTGPAPA